jgi:ABC-type phosphate/phosphonate transport system substrate-binding protein
VEGDTFCELPIAVDDSFKQVYTVGVLAIRGIKEAYQEFNATFADYLTETAGKRFDPPIRFEMKVLDFITLFSDAESKGVDFIYLNPSAYSCIDSEYEAPSLVSQVSRRNVGGNVYDLKKFGGVIAALADRDDIRSILDLKDKVVAAASISGSGSGQMQFKRMVDNGMNYLQDPKQLVFTSDQALVVEGIMNGDFDVGFVRTDQLERTVDGAGNPVDSAIFKIVAPVKNLTIDGVHFPFESSTELYPEWNVAALTHVNPTVGREVQRALLLTAEYGAVGKALSECEALNGTDVCRSLDLSEIYSGPLSCSATHDTVAAAYLAQTTGKYAGWTTSLSYMQLRSMQEATGFISMDSDSLVWRCVRDAELYDAISCPAGYNLKSKAEVDAGCTAIGLECKEGYQCICRPCEAPFELLCVDSVKVGDSCISLAIFLPSIIVPVLLIVALVVHFYLEWKRRQADSLWVIMPSELKFESPPTVIGQGTFGLVLLAEYRGTEVAVKRVIPASAHTIGYATLFDVTTNNGDSRSISRSFVQALDPEYGTLSMHPGLKPMGPRKLGTRLQIQVEHAAMEEPEQTRWKMFLGLMSCKHAERDIRDVLKVEFVNEIRQLARLR